MTKVVVLSLFFISMLSCTTDNEYSEIRRMIFYWTNQEIKLPISLPCKVLGQDYDSRCLFDKKFKIFTYIDTIGCSECNFGALDWKHLINEMDSLSDDVAFLFYLHSKNYSEFEHYLNINDFNTSVKTYRSIVK